MNATIWHNPRCSKSREALALLTAAGASVTIVEYLKTPPSRAELSRIYARAGMTAADGLRRSEPAAASLVGASDDAILDAMVADPKLIERPLVETDKGARLGRPPETVLEIL
ncbi:MAG: arsenate reductase (glutaredoxin) [Pseudomonadota bacterium]